MAFPAFGQIAPSNSGDLPASSEAVQVPAQVKPAAESAARPVGGRYQLPASPDNPAIDVCGQPIGTSYAEMYPCPNLEKLTGPYVTWKTPWEQTLNKLALSMAILFAFGYLIFHWLCGGKADEFAARNYIIIIVVGSAVFILTAGYDDKQAAPLFALLGTLLGYLFGRAVETTPKTGTSDDSSDESAGESAGGEDKGKT